MEALRSVSQIPAHGHKHSKHGTAACAQEQWMVITDKYWRLGNYSGRPITE